MLSICSVGGWALRTGPGLCLQPPLQGKELIPRPGLSCSCAQPPSPRGPGSCGACGRLGVAAHCPEQTRRPLPVTDFLPGPQEPEKGHFWHHGRCRQLAGCRPPTGVSPVAAWGQCDFSQSPLSPPPTAPLDNGVGHSDLEIGLHFDRRGALQEAEWPGGLGEGTCRRWPPMSLRAGREVPEQGWLRGHVTRALTWPQTLSEDPTSGLTVCCHRLEILSPF